MSSDGPLQKIKEQYKNYKAKSFGNLNENELKRYIEYISEISFLTDFKGKDYWGDVVIDFGGRIGEKTRKIKNVTVVDIGEDNIRYMKKHGIKCERSIDKFKDGSVDLIFASHVLEHLHDPYKYLIKFKKKLKKGGKLILILPADSHKERDPEYYDDNGHMYCWNIKTINTLLRFVGLKVKESKILFNTGNWCIIGNWCIRCTLEKIGLKDKTIAKLHYTIVRVLGEIYKKTIMKVFSYVLIGGCFYIIAEKE